MYREQIVDKLKEIIEKSIDVNKEDIIGDNLITELGINSVDALEILVWVENTFDIIIEDEDLSIDLLSSINTLADYVENKLNE